MGPQEREKILNDLQITEEVYDELLNDFVKYSKGHLKKLKGCLEKADFEGIHYILHSMKGSSSNLRLTQVVEAVKRMSTDLNGSQDMKVIEDDLKILEEKICALGPGS